jgi:hypothetical protein
MHNYSGTARRWQEVPFVYVILVLSEVVMASWIEKEIIPTEG